MSHISSPAWLTPRDYQQEAVNSWLSSDGKGIFHMATGTGKTITALLCVEQLADLADDRIATIIAVPYQHLVDQWRDELAKFGGKPHLAYRSRTEWMDSLSGAITEFSVGVRSSLEIITTHKTFATDHFQSLLGRIDGDRTVFIADEVHHLGAPHYRNFLPTRIRFRLGLSATPKRWYDEEGTDALYEYFSNGIVYEYGLGEAIKDGHLSEYYYIPHIVRLTGDEADEYLELSYAIASILAGDEFVQVDFYESEQLKHLLLRRARLIGTAENKTHLLEQLIDEIGPSHIHHSLVYCGDGSVGSEGEDVKRQIRLITELLGNKFGIHVHQFTYEEDQPTRQRLLTGFKDGRIQALVAIRCLDEGVDVPATHTAFMLASSTNPRQFVQRRGRILRTHEDKPYSIIHDFIVAPPEKLIYDDPSVFTIERNLLKKELVRVNLFAEHARNHPDAELRKIPTTQESITELKKSFNLLDF